MAPQPRRAVLDSTPYVGGAVLASLFVSLVVRFLSLFVSLVVRFLYGREVFPWWLARKYWNPFYHLFRSMRRPGQG